MNLKKAFIIKTIFFAFIVLSCENINTMDFIIIEATIKAKTALEIEACFVNPIEQAFMQIQRIDKLISSSLDGQAVIYIFFDKRFITRKELLPIIYRRLASINYLPIDKADIRYKEDHTYFIATTEVDKHQLNKIDRLAGYIITIPIENKDVLDLIITGGEERSRNEYADFFIRILENINGIIDIKLIQDPFQPIIEIKFNHKKLTILGISLETANKIIAEYLNQRGLFYLDGNSDLDLNDLQSIPIPNNKGDLIPLSAIARFIYTSAPTTIPHFNGQRSLTVSIDYNPNIIIKNQIIEMISAEYKKYLDPVTGIQIFWDGY